MFAGTVREAEVEVPARLAEITDMLLAAGYFRARIASLSAFDKILGGLAWCITASNVDVDIDLFFSEEATLGMKIELGENIEKALRRMKCPYPLQSHQIRGLDYDHVFPVIQWLVKQVMATRAETGDRTRKYSEAHFDRRFAFEDDEQEALIRQESRVNVESIVQRHQPHRRFRRTGRPDSDYALVQSVLLEYGDATVTAGKSSGKGDADSDGAVGTDGQRAKQGTSASSAASEGMESVGDAKISGSDVARLVGLQADEISEAGRVYAERAQAEGLGGGGGGGGGGARGARDAHRRAVAALEREIGKLDERHNAARAALADAAARLAEAKERVAAREERNAQLEHSNAKLREAETDENRDDLRRLMGLVTLNESLKAQETEFREACKREMASLKAEIVRLEEAPLPEEEMERMQRVEELFQAETAKAEKLRQLLAAKTREIHILRRKIDDVPTRSELVQYERRFVELYQQVEGKLEETRNYYDKYNTLTDTHKFMTKEISILNSIHDQFATAMRSDESRRNFVSSMENILKGVKQNLEKVNNQLDAEKERRDKLNERYNKLLERQRAYFKAVKEFQEECNRNEELANATNSQ